MRLYVYVLLNASVNVKNNSQDCFYTLLFKSALSAICLQGFVGTKCRNSGTSMLAYMSEAPAWRRQGSVPYTMAQVQSTKIPISPPRAQKEKQGFVLAFRKTRVQLYVYVLLNASVLLALRPLRTSNSNDKRLISLCFVVIAKNGGCPPFS